MSLKRRGKNYFGTHIKFVLVTEKSKKEEKRITDIWNVFNKHDGDFLGEVKWYSHWRKYCLYTSDTYFTHIFEETCLRDTADFIEARTKEHRKARRKKK